MKGIIKNLAPHIFLIDGVGAFLTAINTGIIFILIQEWIGMPYQVLIPLAIIAAVFCIYSLGCHFFLKRNRRNYLRAIAIGNLMYISLTAILVYLHFDRLELLGIIYFVSEIMIVSILIYIEFSISKIIDLNQ